MEFNKEAKKIGRDAFGALLIVSMFAFLLMIPRKAARIHTIEDIYSYMLFGLIIGVIIYLLIIIILFLTSRAQKVVINNKIIICYKKYFKDFRRICSIKLEDIDYISVEIKVKSDSYEETGYFYIVDKTGEERFSFTREIADEDGRQLFSYLVTELEIPIKRETR